MSLRSRSESLQISSGPLASSVFPVATTSLVAAVAGQSVRVYSMVLQAVGASTVQIVDTAGSPVKLSGLYTFTAAQFLILPDKNNGDPWFQTAIGFGLQIVVGTAAVAGEIYFTQGQ